jgi:predicted amidohydrolase YtcJ
MYTINNAYMTFEDATRGSIEVGKLADLAVLTHDILNCPDDAIKSIRAQTTILGGAIVHSGPRL